MAVKENQEKEESRSLLSKIKSMFSRGKVPEKTEMLISGVESVNDLRVALDKEITENEVYAGQVDRELLKIGEQVEEQKEQIKSGSLTERAKINALRTIKRLNGRIQSYERRLKILQDNIDLHFTILNQVDEMEAMEMKAVKRDQIEEIAVDYEERLEKHRDFVAAVRSSVPDSDYEDMLEKKELAELEASIMAEKEVEDPSLEQLEQEIMATKAAVDVEQPLEPVKGEEAVENQRPSIEELMKQRAEGKQEEEAPESVKRRLEME
jgi:hypothetical protein